MGFIIGGQATGPGTSYFITQGPTSGDSDNKSIALDSSGNIYSIGTLTSGSGDISLIKYDSTGTVVWQYKIDSGVADTSMGIHIDSSNNIFVVGRVGGGVGYTGTGNIWVAKFNTSGAIQWQRKMSDSDRWDDGSADGYCIASDSSGNLYVGGWLFNQMSCLIKLNSSGVIQWFKMGNAFATNHLVADSSDNLYIMTSSTGARGQEYGRPGTILKLNSSGTQIWQKTWAQGPGTTNYAGGLALSSSGSYLYASFSANNSDAFLAKLSTTDGSEAWQRKVSGVGNEYGGPVAVDSSENIYWATSQLYNYDNNVGFNNQKAVIFKYNSSGTIQWQRQMYVSGIGYPNNFDYLNKIVVNGSDFYVAGHMNTTNIFAKLPVDGTQTSATAYSVNGKSIIYNASTLSEGSTGTLTLGDEAATQFTNITGWVESATTLTPSTSSYTISRTVTGTGAGVPIASGMTMGGTGTGMVISSYVAPPPSGATTTKAIFGYGSGVSAYSLTNLVSNTGVVATDTAGVGTIRSQIAAAGYGSDKAIFGYGYTSSWVSMTNLVSNTGVVAADTTGVGTARSTLAATGYGTDKAIFGYGSNGGGNTAITNLVSNTGVVATDTAGVGTVRSQLAATRYGEDKAIFGYGYIESSPYNVSITNLVSNTGVVASDTAGVGTIRLGLAATGYGTDKAIFGYGNGNKSMTNLVSNTGVVASDTTGVGTGRNGLAAATYGSDKAIFGYGYNSSLGVVSITNLVSNTGVVSSDTTGVGTARYTLGAAGYSQA